MSETWNLIQKINIGFQYSVILGMSETCTFSGCNFSMFQYSVILGMSETFRYCNFLSLEFQYSVILGMSETQIFQLTLENAFQYSVILAESSTLYWTTSMQGVIVKLKEVGAFLWQEQEEHLLQNSNCRLYVSFSIMYLRRISIEKI